MPKKITLNHITKIEGHAKLDLTIEKNEVTKCQLSAVEGSRYFEGIVLGRPYFEAHEITSRICGICSCAHVIAALTAIEDALGIVPSRQTKELRILMTLGERIRSHATHLYFLALPDYVGYESALAMAPFYKKEIQDALFLMRIGNEIITALGARDLHPVSATVGGWLKIPANKVMGELRSKLEESLAAAERTASLFSGLTYPGFESDTQSLSLVDKKTYAVLDGNFGNKQSLFPKKNYQKFISEYHEPYSTANFVVKSNHRYMVGALARLNNNSQFLSPLSKKLLRKSKLRVPSLNPFFNNKAQAIELVHCIEEAIAICKRVSCDNEMKKKILLRAGTGIAAIEVPRGTLWHEYTLNEKGIITHANIITPTAQNLLNMQEDIRYFVPSYINHPKKDIILSVEKLIRSYDPCFSCSAHFLEVKWKRH